MQNNLKSWLKKSYIAIILMIIYIPLIFIVIWSFTNPSEKDNITSDASNGWGGGNYLQLVQNQDFLNALLNTFIIVAIVTPVSVLIATITSYSIWNNRKGFDATTQFISKISLVNPEIITAISLTLLLSSTWIAIGCNFGFFTIILSHISFCTPYALIVIYPRMTKFNKNLLDASNDLGYNATQTFFRIVIPYLLPSIVGAIGIVAVMSFDDFIITNLVRGRVPTISSEMYLMAKGIKGWVVALGAILITTFITIISIKSLIGHIKEKHTNKTIIYKNYKRKEGKDEKVQKNI